MMMLDTARAECRRLVMSALISRTVAERQVSEEVRGRVKWFDINKGFGFIIPDDDGSDVLLHVSTCQAFGCESVPEGATILFTPEQRSKGVRVDRIISVDESTATLTPATSGCVNATDVKALSGLEIVVVKWFNQVRGFGFVTRGEGTEDIFLHMELVRKAGLLAPKPGDSLLVRYGKGDKGLIATEARLLQALSPQKSN
ncbi:MAG: cold-shock protein [Candidatus Kaiserbacteria bacterium]|nr:cold-shock protein [Candidatus Kaiserbacteria bacterium]